jgi:serine/threonine protein kinase
VSNVCPGLTLLFLARWVHRDVSEGNIILVRSEHGVRAKLSDLEYAGFFAEDRTISTDPKTVRISFCGIGFYLIVELHRELPTSCH